MVFDSCMVKKTGSTLYKRRERTLPVVNVKLLFASFLGYDSFSKDGCEVKTEQNISGGCQCIVLWLWGGSLSNPMLSDVPLATRVKRKQLSQEEEEEEDEGGGLA